MDDDWTSAASTDDAMVAVMLLKLKHSVKTGTKSAVASSLVPFRWGRRKARSRPRPDVTRLAMCKEYKERATRSPTTPLSWSGGCGTTSVSGNVDGFEASSMVMCGRWTSSRSKIAAAYELANSKKAKRKKTYSELKSEECLLLDERLNLKRDLANMQATLTHHRMANQNLKRIKSMNMHSKRMSTTVAEHPIVCVPMLTIPSMIQGPPAFKAQDSNKEIPHPSLPCFSSNNFPEAKDKKSVILPDLNMLPSID